MVFATSLTCDPPCCGRRRPASGFRSSHPHQSGLSLSFGHRHSHVVAPSPTAVHRSSGSLSGWTCRCSTAHHTRRRRDDASTSCYSVRSMDNPTTRGTDRPSCNSNSPSNRGNRHREAYSSTNQGSHTRTRARSGCGEHRHHHRRHSPRPRDPDTLLPRPSSVHLRTLLAVCSIRAGTRWKLRPRRVQGGRFSFSRHGPFSLAAELSAKDVPSEERKIWRKRGKREDSGRFQMGRVSRLVTKMLVIATPPAAEFPDRDPT